MSQTGLMRFICVNGLYLAVHNELRVSTLRDTWIETETFIMVWFGFCMHMLRLLVVG